MNQYILIIFCAFSLYSKALANPDTLVIESNDELVDYSSPEMQRWCIIDSIIDLAKNYVGTPYKYAGCSPSGFDCSGFMNFIHAKFGIDLVRSSREIAKYGTDVKFENIEPGDLVFFKGRKTSTNTVGHVGFVVEKKANSFTMIHASVSNGVRYDEYTSAYYKTRFLFAKRINYPVIDSTVVQID